MRKAVVDTRTPDNVEKGENAVMKTGKQLFFFTIITIIAIIAIALLRWLLQAFEWRSPLFAFIDPATGAAPDRQQREVT